MSAQFPKCLLKNVCPVRLFLRQKWDKSVIATTTKLFCNFFMIMQIFVLSEISDQSGEWFLRKQHIVNNLVSAPGSVIFDRDQVYIGST